MRDTGHWWTGSSAGAGVQSVTGWPSCELGGCADGLQGTMPHRPASTEEGRHEKLLEFM
ncbi:hypothetical protein BCR44DRAFT_1444329 [Catenaria anguillulae PL171]|uniref:Uncharacterized protein n=1 Tax=Catenaria anguillulae PL171 TaxID=765915 RepID=A0A1Y2H7R4_9FUNG|nr:hypothetical protein BCR44DRAFT_1444329 [Catenaria anguillulae PL171]